MNLVCQMMYYLHLIQLIINFNISFYDQNFNPLKILDSNLCIILMIDDNE